MASLAIRRLALARSAHRIAVHRSPVIVPHRHIFNLFKPASERIKEQRLKFEAAPKSIPDLNAYCATLLNNNDASEVVNLYESQTGLFSGHLISDPHAMLFLNDEKLYRQYMMALTMARMSESEKSLKNIYSWKFDQSKTIRDGLLAGTVTAVDNSVLADLTSKVPIPAPSSTATIPPSQEGIGLTDEQIAVAALSKSSKRAKSPAVSVVNGNTSATPTDSLAASTVRAMSEYAPYTISSSGPAQESTSQSASQNSAGKSSASSTTAGAGNGSSTRKEGELIRVIVEEAKQAWWLRALRFLGVTAVYSFLLLTFYTLMTDTTVALGGRGGRAGASNLQPTAAGTVKFTDVHGCDEAKGELQEVVEFLKDPTKFAKLGGKLPRGVLMTGPPGTGKTLLARAVAGEAGVQFFAASGSEFDDVYVGVGARRVRELFAAARKASPAIIFIDELDTLGAKRSKGDFKNASQTLNQLLVELDGFAKDDGVILIGATNFPESLDKALTRPGRFDKHVVVPLPDVRGRLQIIKHYMGTVRYNTDIDASVLARTTIGFSGADIQNLVNQAAVKAARDGSEKVELADLIWAKDRISMGAERKSAFISPETKRLTAFHEGGHALVALYTKGSVPLHSITCMPRGNALGLTHFLPEMDTTSVTFTELRARLDVAFGGRAAEELVSGKENITTGAQSDISQATKIANAMVKNYGFSDVIGPVELDTDREKLSSETLAAVETEVRGLIEQAQDRARQILIKHRVELDRLANALIEFETLTRAEVEKVIKGEKLDRTIV